MHGLLIGVHMLPRSRPSVQMPCAPPTQTRPGAHGACEQSSPFVFVPIFWQVCCVPVTEQTRPAVRSQSASIVHGAFTSRSCENAMSHAVRMVPYSVASTTPSAYALATASMHASPLVGWYDWVLRPKVTSLVLFTHWLSTAPWQAVLSPRPQFWSSVSVHSARPIAVQNDARSG